MPVRHMSGGILYIDKFAQYCCVILQTKKRAFWIAENHSNYR